MSGHSKWSTIKRAKGATDARRSQIFTKLAREITVAARRGGADPDMNVRLRLAIQRARDQNMPTDNVERAIKRGVGPGDGAHAAMEEVLYEGYGPGGAAIFLEAFTDNPNRTVAELRNAFTRGGGNLGERGCVSWIFESKGIVVVDATPKQAEELALQSIDAGADDFDLDGRNLEIRTSPETFEQVRKAVEKAGVTIARAELSMVPKTTLSLDVKRATQTLHLMDRLEEMDDVQHVYTNADFPDEALEEYQKAS
ncbi:MAG: YebC/PmpR family DNA-binding transcriptional regulator [Chloroflexota bacterium]